VPTAAYGAGAAQPGTWNAVDATAAATAIPLLDLAGAPTTATLVRVGGFGSFTFNNAGTSGDDQALMDDYQDVGTTGSQATWTFAGLADGSYTLYTYAWAPDGATFISGVSGGTVDPTQLIGGPWPGAQTQGVTYAVHHFTVTTGSTIDVVVDANAVYGTVNGFQLRRTGAPLNGFCFGDGSGAACPCGNAGTAGNGCANSLNPAGANLATSGVASVANDSLRLQGSGMPNAPALYFQGTSQVSGGAGVAFGDGLRCAGGQTTRLGTQQNVGGASQHPTMANVPISQASVIIAGDVRHYQIWYRNAATFCTPDTFNLSNGVTITWIP
jgi:hypothetical protein